MARQSTPSFIVTLALSVPAGAEREMLVRLEVGRQLYNTCLGEALRRLDRLRDSIAWSRARAIKGKGNAKQRVDAFKAARAAYGFTSAAISAFGTRCKNEAGWDVGPFGARLGAHETQRLAERAFASVDQYSMGVRGRPRFKGKGRPLHSLEGKSAGSGIRWSSTSGCLMWGQLTLGAKRPTEQQDSWIAASLSHRTKYARVVWRMVKGRRRWFVQLVQEGQTPLKRKSREGIVGLDVGPSTIAVVAVTAQAAALEPLCPEVEQPWRHIRGLQRAMERSRRATNSECFNADGTYKRGTKITTRSVAYRRLARELAETERVLQARRDRAHGQFANNIVGLGSTVQTEKLSYVAFQKAFGRSTKVRAVGSLMEKIRRKAERAGGALIEVDTWSLKLSQYDHPTRTYTKKPLSQRWHALGDGSGVVQRDIYSAFLAANVRQDALHPHQVDEAWSGAHSLLGRVGWLRSEPVSVVGLLATTSRLPKAAKALERVTRQRTLAGSDTSQHDGMETAGSGFRPPCL